MKNPRNPYGRPTFGDLSRFIRDNMRSCHVDQQEWIERYSDGIGYPASTFIRLVKKEMAGVDLCDHRARDILEGSTKEIPKL